MDLVAVVTLTVIGVFVATLAVYLIVIAVILRQVQGNAQRILDELAHLAEAASPVRDLVDQVASVVGAPAGRFVGVEDVQAGAGSEED